MFVTLDPDTSPPPSAANPIGNLSGVVSVVDSKFATVFSQASSTHLLVSLTVLALFARLANVQHVDSRRVQRHRRESSASSQSSAHGAIVGLRRDVSTGSGNGLRA